MASNEIEIPGSTDTLGKLKKIAAGRALNRRHFLAALGMTGAAAGAGFVSGCSSSTTAVATTTPSTPAQTDYLNFLLNIKFLEATFYSFISQGTDLTGTAVQGSGAITGAPAKIVFTGTNATQITDMINEIYYDEKNHVSTLISVLSSSVVFRPAINLAAYGAITATNALSIARLLEDVGVTALAGATGGLSTSNLGFVSLILGAESFHAGAIRLVSIQNPTLAAYISAGPLDVPPHDEGTAALAAAGPTASGGFFGTAGSTTSTPSEPAGFAFTRTSSQVLAIAFGSPGTPAAAGTTSGGFFPGGVTGNIKSV
jgi:hypothetical protein